MLRIFRRKGIPVNTKSIGVIEGEEITIDDITDTIYYEEASQTVLLIIDYQKAFLNENSVKVKENIRNLLANTKFDKIYQSLWYNGGVSNFTELLRYEECSMMSDDSQPILQLREAQYFPRVNKYSALTEELRKSISHNMKIYLAGLEIDACVLATAFSLFDEGVRFHILEDCTSTKNEDIEEAAKKIIRRNIGKQCLINSKEIYTERG